jgi:hypothetical protein
LALMAVVSEPPALSVVPPVNLSWPNTSGSARKRRECSFGRFDLAP